MITNSDNLYLLNKKEKYLYETIVTDQYNNIRCRLNSYKCGLLNITINKIDLYYKILYNNEKFNIYNFMLFENLCDIIKEKIYIIDTILTIIYRKKLKNITYLQIYFTNENIPFELPLYGNKIKLTFCIIDFINNPSTCVIIKNTDSYIDFYKVKGIFNNIFEIFSYEYNKHFCSL
jgi:hypothetical protein